MFPWEHRFRTAAGILVANAGIQTKELSVKAALIPAVKQALISDPTQADLLAMLIDMDIAIGNQPEAQFYLNQFKRVAKKSALIAKFQGK